MKCGAEADSHCVDCSASRAKVCLRNQQKKAVKKFWLKIFLQHCKLASCYRDWFNLYLRNFVPTYVIFFTCLCVPYSTRVLAASAPDQGYSDASYRLQISLNVLFFLLQTWPQHVICLLLSKILAISIWEGHKTKTKDNYNCKYSNKAGHADCYYRL